jgi:hypothetical protein
MNGATLKKCLTLGLIILVCSPALVLAQAEQAAPIPHHLQPLTMRSGVHDGRAGVQSFQAFRDVVRIPDAAWLRVHFSRYNLGTQSYLTITSLKDGGQQRLDAAHLKRSRGNSAFFNGEAVAVELHVAEGEAGVFFELGEVMVGERGTGFADIVDVMRPPPEASVEAEGECRCGNQDDRVASNDPAIGRIVPDGRTAWIASNGAYVTSGYGLKRGGQLAGLQILEFNVPPSDPDGTINHPPPEHQYPIDTDMVIFEDGINLIHSFAVFNCLPNSKTGLLPVHVQRAFYRVTRGRASIRTSIRVTGFGIDGPPPNFGFPGNSDNRTQQTATGEAFPEDRAGNWRRHSVTVPSSFLSVGNLGSPMIIDDGSALVVGIHNLAACSVECPLLPQEGYGVTINWDTFRQGLQRFPGENVVYVDKDHPIPRINQFQVERNGQVDRPFDTIKEAVDASPHGAIVSVVTGSYSGGMTINKALTLTAPVGPVTIGK